MAKFKSTVDLDDNILKSFRIEERATDPSQLQIGRVYVKTDPETGQKAMFLYNGTNLVPSYGGLATSTTPGRLSAADKILLAGATSLRGPSSLVLRDEFGSAAFTNVTASDTVSAQDSMSAPFFYGESTNISDGIVSTPKLQDGAVTSSKLGGSAVTEGKIASGAVLTESLANDAVTAVKLADQAVSSDSIQTGAVTTEKLNTDAVTTEKIALEAVTEARLAPQAVTRGKIADEAIGTAQLGLRSVNNDKLALNSVTDGIIANDAISSRHLTDFCVFEIHIIDNAVTNLKIPEGELTLDRLATAATSAATPGTLVLRDSNGGAALSTLVVTNLVPANGIFIDLSGSRLTGIAPPAVATDLVTKGYVDSLPMGGVNKFSETLTPNGTSSEFTIVNQIGSSLVVAAIFNNATGDIVDVAYTATSDEVIVKFSAIMTEAHRVVVFG